ncbi:MAG: hypothetical protein IT559_00185 [Alphaproteobacteria bacterium]|nr:hypothetical protein [Alphaproteobacteria bacterium]
MNAAFAAVFVLIAQASSALAAPAGPSVSDVTENMVRSTETLPALIAAFAYLFGILMGVLGVLKLRDHVENPTQTPLKVGVIRLLIGGMLFALPIIYEAAYTMINGTAGAATLSFDVFSITQAVSGMLGTVSGFLPTMNVNEILNQIRLSVEEVPALISAAAYLIGLLLGFTGILKLREHVENPEQVPLKEVVIRFVTAGALFALPTIYNAMFDVVGGNGIGVLGILNSLMGAFGFFYSTYAQTACNPAASVVNGLAGTSTMGQALCGVFLHTGAIPAFLTAASYLIGLVFGFWGIFKIKAHVQNPQQTGLWEGISRFIAGGAFFALPIVIAVARTTFVPLLLNAPSLAPVISYNNGSGLMATLLASLSLGGGCPATAGPLGLDGVIVCFMGDMMGPIHVVLNFFAFCAGIIFLMIGVSRLIRSAQDGARGPGGIGTIMTFATGAALISYNELMRAFTTSFFSTPVTRTFATMQYTTGMLTPEVDSAHAVITAIIQFVIVVGLISFVRGIFIVRSVAEGNSQASIMSGVTHMVAGALAVNLGPLLNAVQTTLGIQGFGVAFSYM